MNLNSIHYDKISKEIKNKSSEESKEFIRGTKFALSTVKKVILPKSKMRSRKGELILPLQEHYGRDWTAFDDLYVLANIGKFTREEIGRMIGRTKYSVRNRALKLSKYKKRDINKLLKTVDNSLDTTDI